MSFAAYGHSKDRAAFAVFKIEAQDLVCQSLEKSQRLRALLGVTKPKLPNAISFALIAIVSAHTIGEQKTSKVPSQNQHK
jgi:hypothetical protein